ncbi:MAG: hypothetical protein Q7K45_03625 [Nanoarchaeota archaeon]|nr:hypothetical protein [Nanoarchaeota archaeon]
MIKYLPLLLMLLVSCTPPVVDVDTQTSDDFTVRLEIFYGSSSLPNTEVVIENNTLMVTRKDYEDFSQKLSVEDFERLKRTILDNEFFSLPPEYKKNDCVDCIAYSITINDGDKSHTITCQNYDSCSQQFNIIKREIVLLWEYGTYNWPLPVPTANLARAYHPRDGRLLYDSIQEEKEIIQRMNARLECSDGSVAQRIEVVGDFGCVDCYEEWVIDCPNDNQFLVVVSEVSSRGGFFLFEGRPFG